MSEKEVPSCGGHQCWTDYGYEYDCEYEHAGEFSCEHCIVVTSIHGDMSGFDPRTGKKFNEEE